MGTVFFGGERCILEGVGTLRYCYHWMPDIPLGTCCGSIEKHRLDIVVEYLVK